MSRKSRDPEPGEASKWCSTCNDGDGAYRSLDSFWTNKARYDGLQAHCVECQMRYDRENPAQRNKRKKKWVAKSKPFAGHGGAAGKETIRAFEAGEDVVFPGDAEADAVLSSFLDDDITRSKV